MMERIYRVSKENYTPISNDEYFAVIQREHSLLEESANKGHTFGECGVITAQKENNQ